MQKVLDFIEIFKSPSNIELFTDCACYYFAAIMETRFHRSILMYNPHKVHFATKIFDTIYDINGVVDDPEDYVSWSKYSEDNTDANSILDDCMLL